jgi:hypothetical protein
MRCEATQMRRPAATLVAYVLPVAGAVFGRSALPSVGDRPLLRHRILNVKHRKHFV